MVVLLSAFCYGAAAAVVASALVFTPVLVRGIAWSLKILTPSISYGSDASRTVGGFALKSGTLLGLLVSAYLLSRDLGGSIGMCPPGAADCREALGSSGSAVLVFPLPLWGVAAYSTIAATLVFTVRATPFAFPCLLVLVTLCLWVSGILSLAQLWSNGPLCPWCLLSGTACVLMAESLVGPIVVRLSRPYSFDWLKSESISTGR